MIGLQETRRPVRTDFAVAGFRVFCCGTEAGRQHRGGDSSKDSTYTIEYIDEIVMAIGLRCRAINFAACCGPPEVSTDVRKRTFWGISIQSVCMS